MSLEAQELARRIVEIASVDSFLKSPLHPYSQGLLEAVPQPDPTISRLEAVTPGEVPSPRDPPPGCHFHPRCRFARDLCRMEAPELVEAGPDHRVACHFWSELAPTAPQEVVINTSG